MKMNAHDWRRVMDTLDKRKPSRKVQCTTSPVEPNEPNGLRWSLPQNNKQNPVPEIAKEPKKRENKKKGKKLRCDKHDATPDIDRTTIQRHLKILFALIFFKCMFEIDAKLSKYDLALKVQGINKSVYNTFIIYPVQFK